jgi:RNA polymerase sigma-70 factor (ECF subfamily)
MNILHNKEDADEVVNDTYLRVWDKLTARAAGSIERPKVFSTFIGRITRNLSLNKYKMQRTQKRGGNESPLLLSELEGCIPSAMTVEDEVDINSLTRAVNSFLETIREDDMIYFIRRYWHTDSIAEISRQLNVSEGKIKVSLHRTRKKLKIYLEERGVLI